MRCDAMQVRAVGYLQSKKENDMELDLMPDH